MIRPPISRFLLLVAYLGFISLGLPDASTGVAWPSIRRFFDLPQAALGSLLFTAGVGYLLTSFFAGLLVKRLGIGVLLATSSALVGLGLFGYAVAPFWIAMLCSGFTIGLGSGAIDAGLNSYAAERFPPRHMNWLHASFGIGAMTGPLIMTLALGKLHSFRFGYGIIGIMLLAMATLFLFTKRSWNVAVTSSDTPASTVRMVEVIQHPMVQLQVLAFFLYAGLEVTAGQWSYSILLESRGFASTSAGTWASAYWGALAAGRVLFGFLVDRFESSVLLKFSSALCLIGCVLFSTLAPFALQPIGLLCISFALAPFFPVLMSETPTRVGKSFASYAIGFQVAAATVGIAAFPAIGGLLADRFGLESIPVALIILSFLFVGVHEVLRRSPLPE